MVDKLPWQITGGPPNRGSTVHASDNDESNLSRSHVEEDISRLQSAANDYSASLTYKVGDFVFHDGAVRKCIVAIPTPEAFTLVKWLTVSPVDISCKITKTSDQSIPRNISTTITWNSELYDTNDMHDNATNNSRITIKTAGKYSILSQSNWGINSGGFRLLNIIKNGANNIARVRYSAENASEHNISFVGEFAVNDYIELTVFQDTGGNLNFKSGGEVENTYLEAHKIN